MGFDWVGRGEDSRAAFRLLGQCGRLERVRCTINRLRPPGWEALRGVRGLKSVVRLPKRVFNEYTGWKGEEWFEGGDGGVGVGWREEGEGKGWREALELEDWCDVVVGEREEAFEVLRRGMMRERRVGVVERCERRGREVGLLGGKVRGDWGADGEGFGGMFETLNCGEGREAGEVREAE